MADHEDDALLDELAKDGGTGPLERLIERRWAHCFKLALRILGDPGRAAGAAEDALAHAARIPAERKPARADLWLASTVLVAARDQIWSPRPGEAPPLSAPIRRSPRPLGEAAQAEIQGLPIEVRATVVLRAEGHSQDEIAEIMACPKATVSARLRRGLERIRAGLEQQGLTAEPDDIVKLLKEANGVQVPKRPTVEGVLARHAAPAGAARGPVLAAAAALVVCAGVAFVLIKGLANPAARPSSTPKEQVQVQDPGPRSHPGGAPASVPAPEPEPVPAPVPAPEPVPPPAPAPPPPVPASLRVAGRVLDAASGAPIAGAEVRVSRRLRGPGDEPAAWSHGDAVVTGPVGAFASEPVRSTPTFTLAELVLLVRAPGYCARRIRLGTEALGGETTVALEREGALALAGRVVEKKTGQGLELPVKVTVAVKLGEEKDAVTTIVTEARSGRDGAFRIDGLHDDAATIEVPGPDGPITVEARPSTEPEETRIVVDRSARIAVEVRGRSGSPERDARVEVRKLATGERLPVRARGAGAFVLGELEPGKYEVAVTFPREAGLRPVPDLVEAVELRSAERRTMSFATPADMGAAAALAVRFDDGAPAGGVEVWLCRADAPDWSARLVAASDDRGAVRFLELCPGRYRAAPAGAAPGAGEVIETGAPAGEPVPITLPRRVPVKGHVRDAEGQPIAGAVIVCREGPGIGRRGHADPDGAFALEPLARGPLDFVVTAAGRAQLAVTRTHDGRDIDFVLAPGRDVALRGTVPDPESRLEGAEVRAVVELAGGAVLRARPAWVLGGAFQVAIEGLPASEPATLVVRIDGFVPVKRPLEAEAREVALDGLALEPGHEVRGRVADPQGWLQKGGAGVAAPLGWLGRVCEAKLGKDGAFKLEGLPKGVVRVRVELAAPEGGAARLEAEVEVDPAATPDLGVVKLSGPAGG